MGKKSTENLPDDRSWQINPDDHVPSELLAAQLGIALRNHRRRRRMSQVTLGAVLGVSDALISQWETGKTRLRLDDLTRLALALGTSVPEMLAPPVGEVVHEVGNFVQEAVLLKAQEQQLLAAYRAMSLEQRETALRVMQAIIGRPNAVIENGVRLNTPAV